MRVWENARQFYSEFPKQMKKAEALLSELVEHVRPPKGCPVKLKEWPANELTIRNWIAISGADYGYIVSASMPTKMRTSAPTKK